MRTALLPVILVTSPIYTCELLAYVAGVFISSSSGSWLLVGVKIMDSPVFSSNLCVRCVPALDVEINQTSCAALHRSKPDGHAHADTASLPRCNPRSAPDCGPHIKGRRVSALFPQPGAPSYSNIVILFVPHFYFSTLPYLLSTSLSNRI